jgi:hypothetical protein
MLSMRKRCRPLGRHDSVLSAVDYVACWRVDYLVGDNFRHGCYGSSITLGGTGALHSTDQVGRNLGKGRKYWRRWPKYMSDGNLITVPNHQRLLTRTPENEASS